MHKRTLHWITGAVGVCLFTVALWVLFRELRSFNFRDVWVHLSHLPLHRIVGALAFTACNYLALTLYDTLALKYVGHALPYHRTAMTSFIGYAFSHNIGFTFLTSGSVRYRYYSGWGVSTLDVAKIIAFCGITFWLGFCALGSAAFGFGHLSLPESFRLTPVIIRWLGLLLALLLAAYAALSFGHNRVLKIQNATFRMPSPRIAVGQIAASCADWMTVAAVFYSLLPRHPELSYLTFLGIFLLAQVAGMASQIPGGLGVFESIMLLLLESYYPASKILGMLLAYRAIYYILPLITALLWLGIYEFVHRRVLKRS